MIRRLALAVGDTAGHVTPALAVAHAYASLFPQCDIRFFVAGDGAGHWLIERAGYPVDRVPGSAFARSTKMQQAVGLLRSTHGVLRARTILRANETRLVIGTGGFGSVGAILAAHTLGLGTALVEPNVEPGLANRMLGRVVSRAFVAFDETARAFPPGRACRTGIPTPDLPSASYERRRPALPLVKLLITTGSRGEAFFIDRGPELASSLVGLGFSVRVLHQAGTHRETVARAYQERNVDAEVLDFVTDMAAAMRDADVVVARAGAGTIAEIAGARVPALLVPLGDAAHDHQTVNAGAMVARGAAIAVQEPEWRSDAVAQCLVDWLSDEERWRVAVDAVGALAAPEAAARVVEECERLMEGRW